MSVTLLCADYARIMPLATGAVPADFTLGLGRRGSWPDRAQALSRSVNDPAVAGGEGSMGVHLRRIDRGDRSMVALPVFVLRNFTARDLYVRKGSGLTEAAQLAGKRVGMYSWTASGSIWYRHFLAWSGLGLDTVQWFVGDIDKPWGMTSDASHPAHVSSPAAGRSLAQMLVDGELDAIYSPPRPQAFDPAHGPIVRLYADPSGRWRRAYAATGIFPPQHLVVLRRPAWEADRTLARRVTDAFVACEDAFDAELGSFPYVTPWTAMDVERTAAVMGRNPYAHGLEENRAAMEAFCDQAYKAGLTEKRVAVDDYFREYLDS